MLFSGARRQIFIVFVPFLLVSKFGIKTENMLILMTITSIINIYIAPKIGRAILKYGESFTLKFEYFGLIIIFLCYVFVEDIYIAFALYIIDHVFYAMRFSLKVYLKKIADPKDIITTESVSFSINHVMAVILPFLFGFIWVYSSGIVFAIGAFIAILSFLFSFLIPKNPSKGYETVLV